MPESEAGPPNHVVTVLRFILASINFTMPLSIDAAFPTLNVWRMRKYGDRLCALTNSGNIDCPRGEMMRM